MYLELRLNSLCSVNIIPEYAPEQSTANLNLKRTKLVVIIGDFNAKIEDRNVENPNNVGYFPGFQK